MNLIVFNKENGVKHPGKPILRSITIYKSNGSIDFTSVTANDLGITEKSNVIFAKDKDKKKDWYLAVLDNYENGIAIRSKKSSDKWKAKKSFSCSCRIVVDAMLLDFNANKNACFLISAKAKIIDNVKWYQIINQPLKIDGKFVKE